MRVVVDHVVIVTRWCGRDGSGCEDRNGRGRGRELGEQRWA